MCCIPNMAVILWFLFKEGEFHFTGLTIRRDSLLLKDLDKAVSKVLNFLVSEKIRRLFLGFYVEAGAISLNARRYYWRVNEFFPTPMIYAGFVSFWIVFPLEITLNSQNHLHFSFI